MEESFPFFIRFPFLFKFLVFFFFFSSPSPAVFFLWFSPFGKRNVAYVVPLSPPRFSFFFDFYERN